MPVKLIQYWDIRHFRKTDFDSFFTQQFVPQINDTGLMQMVGSWHVASGEGPYFIAEGIATSVDKVERLIMAPPTDQHYNTNRRKIEQIKGFISLVI